MINSINLLGRLLDSLINIESRYIQVYPERGRVCAFEELANDLKKMKELTKCDDYEYQTTPAVTKLVKKEKAK